MALPGCVMPAKPVPYSNPLQALILMMAKANSACSLLKMGSPVPAGTPVMVHSMIPPMESPCC